MLTLLPPAGFRTRAALKAEILALRHQLLVLQRSSRGQTLRSVGLTESSWSGSRSCGTLGGRPCSSSSGDRHRLASQRSEEHTSELQSRLHLVCRLLLEKKKNNADTARMCHLFNPSTLTLQ